MFGEIISGIFNWAGSKKARESQEHVNQANADAASLNNELNYQRQKEFAQHGIRWKVEDAKAAGLHPLFALGGAGAAYSPSAHIPASQSSDSAAELMSRAGQNLGRAAGAFLDPYERQMRQATLDAVKAATAKDNALAAAAASESARRNQESTQTAPVAESYPVSLPGVAMPSRWTDQYEVPYTQPTMQTKPLPPQIPGYLTQDIEPGFTRFATPNGEVILPSQKMAESLEALENNILQAYVAGSNISHYSPKANEIRKAIRSRIWSDPLGALQDGVKGYLDKHRR